MAVSEAFIVAAFHEAVERLVANHNGRNVDVFRFHINGKCSTAKGLLARWGLKGTNSPARAPPEIMQLGGLPLTDRAASIGVMACAIPRIFMAEAPGTNP